MPHYFMHLIDGTDELLDPDGIDLPSEAVRGAALSAARDCICGDVMQGRLDLRLRIEVHDEGGEIVQSLPFAQAIEIIAPA